MAATDISLTKLSIDASSATADAAKANAKKSFKDKLAKLMKKVPSRPDRYGKLADPSVIRRKYLLDTGVFVGFVAIFLIVQLANRDNTHSYLMGQQIQDKLVFQDVQEEPPWVPKELTYVGKSFKSTFLVPDWWSFLFGAFYQNAYQPQWYNGRNFTDDNKRTGGWPLYENKVVGAIRLRQIRVKRQNCLLAKPLQGFVYDCFPPYKKDWETHEDFVLTNSRNLSETWTLQWKSQDELAGTTHWGRLETYPGSGYVIDLDSDDQSAAQAAFARMWNSLYIDEQTRVVFIDLVLYNANTGFHSWVRLTSEFPAVGGVLTSFDLRTHKFHRYQTAGDFAILAFEIIFCLLLLYYMAVEIGEWWREGRTYFSDFWNYLDWINYLAFIVAIVFRIRNLVLVAQQEFQPGPGTFVNFEVLAYNVSQETNIFAFNALLLFFRMFRFLYIVPQLRIFIKTLVHSIGRVLAFLVCFFVMFCGFGMGLYVAIGRDIESFAGLGISLLTLFQALLGEFQFSDFQQGNRVLGPLFFVVFETLAFFVFLNVFVAIMNSAYVVLHDELKRGGDRNKNVVEDAVYGYFKDAISSRFDQLTKYAYVISAADKNADGHIDAAELAKLKEQAKDVPGLLEILEAADKNSDLQLDAEEVEELMAKLEAAFQEAEAEQEGTATGELSARGRRVSDGASRPPSALRPPGSTTQGPSPTEERLNQQIMEKLALLDAVQLRLKTIEERLY